MHLKHKYPTAVLIPTLEIEYGTFGGWQGTLGRGLTKKRHSVNDLFFFPLILCVSLGESYATPESVY